jgi:hypothetical protein
VNRALGTSKTIVAAIKATIATNKITTFASEYLIDDSDCGGFCSVRWSMIEASALVVAQENVLPIQQGSRSASCHTVDERTTGDLSRCEFLARIA